MPGGGGGDDPLECFINRASNVSTMTAGLEHKIQLFEC